MEYSNSSTSRVSGFMIATKKYNKGHTHLCYDFTPAIHLLPQLTAPLDYQGLFHTMPHLPIVEPCEGLALTRMCGNETVANNGGV